MILSQKIENNYKNCIEKKVKNKLEKAKMIKALICDLGGKGISIIANLLRMAFNTVKSYYLTDFNNIQLSIEFRGRKKVEDTFPEIKNQIKAILNDYEYVDSHFKTETLFVNLSLGNLRNELIQRYGYTKETCPCKSTLLRLLTDLDYKIQKVKKTKVLDKIPKTDAIFENVNETKQFISLSNNDVAVISIDDKNRKKIGNISDNGYSWFNKKALDHDTNFDCSIVPFGILDLKTNETFVYCSKGSSTANFKVDCIENYLKKKKETFDIKRLIIFLDNEPENSSRRTLWIKCLIDLSKKYNISIELVYYPPYHSKYNPIERYWARLQLSWSGLIINTVDKLIETINKVKWKGVYTQATLVNKEYKRGISIDKEKIRILERNHIYREDGIEKWSLVITP
mgnify:CR=1 FL=1